jgi:hypothetical protein
VPERAVALSRLLAALALLAVTALGSGQALAAGLEDEAGAEWRLAPVQPPEAGVQAKPIGLGQVGDIEFWAPNRGLLITAGSGSTIQPGLWAYNGSAWHQLSTVCGATDGRIAWAGPEEFWTVSDGRPGQATDAHGDPAPIEDDTLCHFAGGAVVGSYASLAFESSSYQPMQGAACLSAADCWFAGDALPEPGVGSFHLHFNGTTGAVEAKPYAGEGHAIEDMRAFDGSIYESARIAHGDPVEEHLAEPPPLHLINRLGVSPTFEPVGGLPLYSAGEFPEALDALHLSADREALWAAAGARGETPEGSEPAPLTVLRYTPALGWSQLLGPETGDPLAGEVVRSIAADPQTQSAWLALGTSSETRNDPTASATIARVDAEGNVTDVQTLPSAQEAESGIGPKGAASHISCPAPHECWLVTTQGWLFHLTATPGSPAPGGIDSDPAFAGPITYRPEDEGVPKKVPDAPPVDDSGLLGEPPPVTAEPAPAKSTTQQPVALMSQIRVRLVHGTTLQMRFHLAVRARIKLIAKRKSRVVAATPMRTLAAGSHALLLRLNRRAWPTRLALQTHALAPLPTVPVTSGGFEHPFTTGAVTPAAVLDALEKKAG